MCRTKIRVIWRSENKHMNLEDRQVFKLMTLHGEGEDEGTLRGQKRPIKGA